MAALRSKKRQEEEENEPQPPAEPLANAALLQHAAATMEAALSGVSVSLEKLQEGAEAVEGSEGTIVDGGRKIELEKLRIVLRAQGHEVTEARCGSGAAGSGGERWAQKGCSEGCVFSQPSAG